MKKVVLFLLLAPVFVWILMRPGDLIKEWIKTPEYLKNNISSLITPDKLDKVFTERWNAFGPEREDFLSKAYYNKATVLIDDFFSMTTYLSPRLYFQSGDGSGFSPPGVEPIAIPLFVFWIMGIVALVKNKKYLPFMLAFFFAAFAYFAGHRNFAFLFPVAIIYTGISVYGIESFKDKRLKKCIYMLLSIYGLYLFGRIFLLK